MKDKDIEWGTSSLGLAATVLSLGAKYSRTDKTDSRRMTFYFVTPEDKSGVSLILGVPLRFNFEDVEREWTNETQDVNAQKFFRALGDLKSIIHSR